MTELFGLEGKVALVTGGGRGLGRAISLGLARAGADVVVTSRKLEACEATVGEIAALGREGLAVSCHMGRWDEVEALAGKALARFGRIDVLVNNAASNPAAMPLSAVTQEFFDRLYAVNVRGPMQLAARSAASMAEHGGGSIINVISVGAFRGGPGLGVYTSCKAALRNLTRVMASEWVGQGVRVNALAPGPFLTDMMEGGERNMPGFTQSAADATLMKRVADPEEIVGSILFLASEASSYMTGETLTVAGGM